MGRVTGDDGRDSDGPAPAGVAASVAHPARIQNFWLGGRDNFKADRAAARELATEFPHLPATVRAQRAFLVRAVRFLAGPARIRQFLDLGSGLPAGGNTHEIAQRVAPDTAIVYVDNDPMVLAHAKALLERAHEVNLASGTSVLIAPRRGAGVRPGLRTGPVNFVDADLRDAAAVLNGAAGTLDFTQPAGLIMAGVLGCLPDYDAARSLVSQLLAALPAGSYLVIADGVNTADAVNRAQLRYNGRAESAAETYQLRPPAEVTGFFDGLELVEPGVVPCHRWKPDRPEDAPAAAADPPVLCGVGRTSLLTIRRIYG